MNRAEQIIKILKDNADNPDVFVRYFVGRAIYHIGGLLNQRFKATTFSKIEPRLKVTWIENQGRVWVHPDSPREDIKVAQQRLLDAADAQIKAEDAARLAQYKGGWLAMEIAEALQGKWERCDLVERAEIINSILSENRIKS